MDVQRDIDDEEWMRTRIATLTLEELIETMGDAFKETFSLRVPAELTYIVGDGSAPGRDP